MSKRKKRMLRIILSAVFELAKIGIAIIPAWLTSLWAIPCAFRERGYYAFGGEWLLIIFTFSVTYLGLSIALEKWLYLERK